MEPRGIRGKNPGNIRRDEKTRWQGMATEQPDPEFITFKSAEYGIRAMARILLSYKKRGLDTISEIIGAWAPPVENNTTAYVNAVCTACGFEKNEVLDVDSTAVMLPLIKAIIRHENGKQPYRDSVILEGMRMAGVYDAKPKPMVKEPAVQGATVATIGGGVAAAGEIARQVREVQEVGQTGIDVLTWLTQYGVGVAIALVLIGGALAIYALWSKHRRTGS